MRHNSAISRTAPLTDPSEFDYVVVVGGLLPGGEAGGLVVFPLWPKIQGQVAKRVIIQARKGKTGKTRITEGLVLHNDDGSYTAEAEAVLRGAGPLVL